MNEKREGYSLSAIERRRRRRRAVVLGWILAGLAFMFFITTIVRLKANSRQAAMPQSHESRVETRER
ncbi:MAG: hypothetical protein V6Z86_06605 [Hyphomicrobiales bacterium]